MNLLDVFSVNSCLQQHDVILFMVMQCTTRKFIIVMWSQIFVTNFFSFVAASRRIEWPRFNLVEFHFILIESFWALWTHFHFIMKLLQSFLGEQLVSHQSESLSNQSWISENIRNHYGDGEFKIERHGGRKTIFQHQLTGSLYCGQEEAPPEWPTGQVDDWQNAEMSGEKLWQDGMLHAPYQTAHWQVQAWEIDRMSRQQLSQLWGYGTPRVGHRIPNR